MWPLLLLSPLWLLLSSLGVRLLLLLMINHPGVVILDDVLLRVSGRVLSVGGRIRANDFGSEKVGVAGDEPNFAGRVVASGTGGRF